MSDWRRARLSEIGVIYDGPHATPKRQSTGPYFLNIASLSNGRLNLDASDHVDEADFAAWTRRVTPQAQDLLFSYETRLGEAALMPRETRACLGRRMALLRPNREVIDPSFLLYAYLGPEFQTVIEQNTIHGATVNRIPLNRMSDWEINVPPLAEQQAIAEVLGALDDKIAANTTLASTATQLASIDFAMVATQTTEISTFADVAEISGGGTPSTKNEEFWDGDIWWATPTDMTALAGPYLESTSRTITAAGLAACNSRLFKPGAILMTSRATIGALAVNSVPTALNQGFIVVEPHDWRLRWWLFHEMESRVDEFISWANGATFLELSRGNFKRLRVRVPSVEVRDGFASRAGALHDAARIALEENRTLAATRDALLPQLMSGKLRVRDAERVVSETGV